jgi:ribose-phosphate pyrophosphokinase
MPDPDIRLFALNATRGFGERIARHLGVPLAEHEERDFEDGEHKARPLAGVRRRDVYVVQSLHGDADMTVNDKLLRLLFFIGALKESAAASVTAVVPYLCYARKDRRTQPRDPVTTRYVARLFEAVGVDRVLTIDVHNLAAFDNAFRCGADRLTAHGLFARHFAAAFGGRRLLAMSPDVGGVKRAEDFREILQDALGDAVPSAFMEKQRSGGKVSGEALVGDVAGRDVILLDDLIATGGTLRRAARAARAQGAERIFAAATHGVFSPGAGEVLGDPIFEQVVVTDTVPAEGRLDDAAVRDKLVVLEAAPLFAGAIERLHTGGSLNALIAESARP